MEFEWEGVITIGVLIFIAFWVTSKIRKRTMRETIEDFKETIAGGKE